MRWIGNDIDSAVWRTVMFEGKLIKTERKGKISYNRNIINSIVTLATGEVEGVGGLGDTEKKNNRLCRIDFIDDDVYVEVFIKIKYGYSASDIACKVQENIKSGVDTMTSFRVKEVNVKVTGVAFD